LAQRESQKFRGSSPSGSGGREAYSRTNKHVSLVEDSRQEVQRQEASMSCVPSMEDLVVSTCFATIIEEASSQKDMRVGFPSVIE
jgi:16S rRNA G966 N2-methylase RsmD